MPINHFLLDVLQTPKIDPELMSTYERLMQLLENDPTLEHMCDELPSWFMNKLTE